MEKYTFSKGLKQKKKKKKEEEEQGEEGEEALNLVLKTSTLILLVHKATA